MAYYKRKASAEIAFRPARVLTHDFSGIPAIVDLAAMRDAMIQLGGDAGKINPISPVDLVIDHSVMIDAAGDQGAFAKMSSLNLNEIRNALSSFDGARVPLITFAWCRLEQASVIK